MLELDKKEKLIGMAAVIAVIALIFGGVYFADALNVGDVSYNSGTNSALTNATSTPEEETAAEMTPTVWPPKLDIEEYNERILKLVDYKEPLPQTVVTPATATTSAATSTFTPPSPLVYSDDTNVTVKGEDWPPAQAYPNGDAILPFKRILAYYGNFYSRHMGILGEYEPAEVLRRLAETQKLWEAADPETPVLPAIEYIAMVAQADAGADGMYRAVMPDAEVEKAYELAKSIDGILILDIQVGLSPLQQEMYKFKEILSRPEVHFALDPEFSMKGGEKPGTVIGTMDATDINYVIDYMSEIVRENELPPKVLLVHRFTQNMVTNAHKIKATPEVQVVMVMDGWGSKDLKRGTYSHIIEPEPVQFTGLKIFYKNDLKAPSTGLLTPAEVLDLNPKPIYIQYQ